MKTLAIILVLLCSSAASAQATWNGRQYSQRQCSSPNCGMCASIQAQLERSRAPAMQSAPPVQQSAVDFETVTEQRPVTRRVKYCDGKRCWYENVTEMVSVQVRRPIQRAAHVQPPAAVAPVAQPAVRNVAGLPADRSPLLTHTELVPTPQPVVDRMIAELNLTPASKLFDLGCGDGRILVAAAKRYACFCVGVELNAATAELARKNAASEFVSPLVLIFHGDARAYDITEADSVAMYLYPELMAVIIPRLRSGTRIASYQHPIPGVDCEAITVQVGGESHTIYVGTKQ